MPLLKIENPYQDSISIHSKITTIKDWHLKDIIADTIPGISLEKAYNTILKNTTGETVIVAVLDTKVDIHHEAFKTQIWTNPNEIPDNHIDDDANGYIDDVHGWNFLGNTKGETVIIENFEYVRIIRTFETQVLNGVVSDTIFNNPEYKRAKEKLRTSLISSKASLEQSNKIFNFYLEARDALKSYFPEYNYSLDVLNSIDTVGNGLSKYVEEIKLIIQYNDSDKNMTRYNQDQKDTYHKKLNLSYFPRTLVGDDPNNLNDTVYGNNKTYDHLDTFTHGTRVVGMITNSSESSSDKNLIKILPVSILPNGGSTHDKDIALGIKYAVNQGAKVINMSFGKAFSLHSEWLKYAFLYAEKHNVLIVSASGNDAVNIDINSHIYPNDSYHETNEFCDNFLYVGASSHHLNSKLSTFSNYGKINVDIFSPGDSVYTTYPRNNYSFDSGTSLASAVASKVAALLFAYYPDLTASQVKHIIMDSGVEFPYRIKILSENEKEIDTPFYELSKSGKIINAYNAFIMADSITNQISVLKK
ncbi:S8 family serine peptidase [Psychroserpens algicola]|uniref:S8 family serine peptidase n=1 Tax=Psychroserpens algicola TaxID=1719034 RepID=A0ABT0HC42_9FLAO|nr:S8 family serine peptidase [Psychroserpens algicola]MCK8481920.1 S8 family serine peptidase [Psychroserpens algicola]